MSIKTTQEFLAALPKPMQDRLAELQQSIKIGLGDELVALLAYGSAVRSSAVTSSDELNLMLVLKEASLEKLGRIAGAITMARYSIGAETMLLTSAEVPRAADVFPLLYDDIVAAHVVLLGSDPFSALVVSDRHRRLRIEQELREAQIRLRRLIIDSLGAREPLIAGLQRKLRQLRSPLSALLKLRQVDSTDQLAEILKAAGKLYGMDVAPLLAVDKDPSAATPVLARLLDAAVHDADQLPE